MGKIIMAIISCVLAVIGLSFAIWSMVENRAASKLWKRYDELQNKLRTLQAESDDSDDQSSKSE